MVHALLSEIELRKDYLKNESVQTIYFGGGTPSLLEHFELEELMGRLLGIFRVDHSAEVTIEINPDDITEEKLKTWKDLGINRTSIGIQSFFEEDLRWMNRVHTTEQASTALKLAMKYFDNITVDLIYGTPLLTNEKWQANVERVIAFGVPHLSCYALTVEPRTPLDKMIKSHRTLDINPEQQSEQFLLLMHWMENAGYEHYEISNFAKPGRRSRHNSSYWQGKKYLGIGPSAHSFDGVSRQWNVSNNNVYIDSIKKGFVPYEREVLTGTQKLNEYIMTSLRTIEGLDLTRVSGESSVNELRLVSRKFLDGGLMIEENNHLRLTQKGKLLADGIAAELFFEAINQ